MRRSVILAVAAVAIVTAAVLVWMDARREREFRRLIAVGDAAVTTGQTFQAIEAFSGALALKPDSMLASLKRGDTYRRRGDYAAALRDLGQAAFLDSSAPRPIELLGDVQTALGQYAAAARNTSVTSGLTTVHRASSTSWPWPTTATARPHVPWTRFAARFLSTIDSLKPTTCSASVCARPIGGSR
jgi:predicted Zn-dependent protease